MLNLAYIDLIKLKENALEVKKHLKPKQLFNAVIKADAYGHGAEKVANALYTIADNFSVAIVEEGVKLRQAGIDKDILVLTPFFDCDLPSAVFYDLTLTVDCVKRAIALEKEAERQNRKVKVQIKFNSGMNRFGVDDLRELNVIARFISESKHLLLDGTFSHFSAPENKKSRIRAENKFLLANNLIKGYNNKAVCHISASGGFLVGAKSDMARIGILLYGYKPFPTKNVSVSPIMKIYAPIVARRIIKGGSTALYGDKRAKRDTEIELIRYGYADGFFREEISGQFNNRCMDATAVIGKTNGELYPVMEDAEALAKKHHTISYEILTKCAMRAEKIYLY